MRKVAIIVALCGLVLSILACNTICTSSGCFPVTPIIVTETPE
jgi:hypothetical protein